MVLKKCMKCGALVKVLKDCNCDNCGIKCCNEEMTIIKPNSISNMQSDMQPLHRLLHGIY